MGHQKLADCSCLYKVLHNYSVHLSAVTFMGCDECGQTHRSKCNTRISFSQQSATAAAPLRMQHAIYPQPGFESPARKKMHQVDYLCENCTSVVQAYKRTVG
jgi:hypothetical protein